MWILPKNISDTCPSVVDTKGLDLDSEEFSQMCEKSLMLKSKPSLSPTWLRRWKRMKYIRALCSRTLKNSHSESFVDAWTSYLGGSPASPSHQVAQENQQKIQGTCSHTSSKESKTANLPLFSWRMSKGSSQPRQETRNQFSSMCSKAWKKWVTEQRQEYSQRLKLGHLTRENECLSWPTATVAGLVEGGVARNVGMNSEGFWAERENGVRYGAKLRDAVIHMEKGTLKEENWPTPTVAEAGKIGKHPNYGQLGVSNHPKVHGYEVEREPLHKDRKGLPKAGLPDPTKNSTTGKNQGLWNTPKASSGEHPDYQCERDRVTPDLETDVRVNMGFPALKQANKGARLNPNWVEQLMGLEAGWTQLPIEWTD